MQGQEHRTASKVIGLEAIKREANLCPRCRFIPLAPSQPLTR